MRQNLIRAIAVRRTIPLARFIYALGIRRIGEQNAKLLARHYGSFTAWRAQMTGRPPPPDRNARLALGSIMRIGQAIAEELVAFFSEPRNLAALDELAALLTIEDAPASAKGALSGKAVVFTGGLATMTRPEAKAIAESLGARVTDTVSKKTDLVILGSDCRVEGQTGGRIGRGDRGRGGLAGAGRARLGPA